MRKVAPEVFPSALAFLAPPSTAGASRPWPAAVSEILAQCLDNRGWLATALGNGSSDARRLLVDRKIWRVGAIRGVKFTVTTIGNPTLAITALIEHRRRQSGTRLTNKRKPGRPHNCSSEPRAVVRSIPTSSMRHFKLLLNAAGQQTSTRVDNLKHNWVNASSRGRCQPEAD